MVEGIRQGRSFVVASLLCAAALLCGCRRGAPREGATVEIREGVRIVRNPIDPVPALAPPALVEDLIVGAGEEEGEPILFQGIPYDNSVDVDSSGNIYVADAAANRIVVIDPGGALIRTLGREGQGPGDFQAPSALRVLADGRLAVYDRTNRRLSFFDLDGRLSGERSLAAHPALFTPQIDSRGDIFGLEMSRNGPVRTMTLLKITSDGAASTRIAGAARRLPLDGSLNLFTTRFDFRLTPDDGVVWGDQQDYVLHILDREERPRTVIMKAYAPLAVTDADIEAELARLGIRRAEEEKVTAPDRFPPFNLLVVADDGRVFVRVRERTAQGVKYAYDVFDGQGFYLFRMRFPGTPVLIKAGRLYALEEGEDGAILVKRYLMK